MDLLAYVQIDRLDKIMKENNISVPRLRGLRLMSEEKRVTEEEILEDIKIELPYVAENLITSVPTFKLNTNCFEYSSWTDLLRQYYLEYDPEIKSRPVKIRWDRIHGWKRRNLKFAMKQKEKRMRQQYETFNKYIGRDDVIQIHARIGGGNWHNYYKEVQYEPWFIEKVDDCFDSTYCDIYARIKKND